MKNKILIPLLIIGALAAFFSFRYAFADGEENKKTATLEVVLAARVFLYQIFLPWYS